MYKIGELSKLSRIPVKTLRYYDSVGLLPPDEIDSFTGYRYYSAAKLSDCYRIVALKELGFSLDEIKARSALPKEKVAELTAAKERELLELKATTERRIKILREIQSALKEDESMFDIVIRKSDGIRVAYDRRIISDRADCGNILREISGKLPCEMIGGREVVIDYETEFRTDTFDTGFGVEIAGKLPPECGLEEKTISFTEDTASLICAGSEYDEAVVALRKYAHEHRFQIVGAIYKIIYEDGTVEIKLPVVKLLPENQSPRCDNVDLPFENDEVVGRWECVDFLPSREQFNPAKPKSAITSERIKELYFLPGGEWYWCFGWTKGYVLSSFGYPNQRGANPYTVERINGEEYMFVEMKFHDYFLCGGKPEVWVLKRADSRVYTKKEIMIRDEIPDIPADDKRVLGKWKVCDLVRNIEDFDPARTGRVVPAEDLFWRSAEFLEGGEMRCGFLDIESGSFSIDPPEVWSWVTGNVIQHPRSAVNMYRLSNIGGEEFLFIQWKNGDYTYGGEKPYWYVFRR